MPKTRNSPERRLLKDVHDALMEIDRTTCGEMPYGLEHLLDKVDRFLHPPKKALPQVEIMISEQNNKAVIRVLDPALMEWSPKAIVDRYLPSYGLEGDWRVDSAKTGRNEDACIAVITAVRRISKRVTPEMPKDPKKISEWWAVLTEEERAVYLKAMAEQEETWQE